MNYPPCKLACPIQTDAREYIQFIAERRFDKALASIKRQNPLPRACGRICTHPCESACKRGQIDAPIAIAALKRFSADGPWSKNYKALPVKPDTGHKVAIVGSGPAGLAAAHDLALLGHQVTLFETFPVLGGMLRVGVPAYRLPKDVLEEEVQTILDLGVTVKTGVRIGDGRGLSDLLDEGFGAVFVAIGAHQDRKLGIPGEDDLKGVVSAVSFLRTVNQDETQFVGKKVAVVGGGNTAIDSARSVRRLGAETVYLVYRRSKEEMPASAEEVDEAIHEGVEVNYLTSPLAVLGEEGLVRTLRCIRNALGEPDASGRRRPEPVADSEFELDVDMVIAAVGQTPESQCLDDGSGFADKRQRICVKDPATLETTRPGIFAGGDAVTGPATVIKAIASGKRAAISIDHYLRKEPLPKGTIYEVPEIAKLPTSIIEGSKNFQRSPKDTIDESGRLRGFDEVEKVYTEEKAVKEALRCLHCYLAARVDKDVCISCLTCVRVCPLHIPTFNNMGEITIDPFACQACGMCALECPVRAIDIGLNRPIQRNKEIEEALGAWKGTVPPIVGFFDLHGNFLSDDIEKLREAFPNIIPIMVFGLRRIDIQDLLKAFQSGAQRVFMAACPAEVDPFPEAMHRIHARLEYAKILLKGIGVDEGRLGLYTMPEKGMMDEKWIAAFLEK